MTTCIAVMNRTAVALAADSTVSIPYRFGKKHFHGVSKVIPAHTRDPVGIMVYGSPDFAGIPWEVVIEEFREDNPASRDSVEEHADRFFDFLERQLGSWADQSIQDELADSLFTPLLGLIEDEWDRRSPSVPSTGVEAALDKMVEQVVSQWKKTERRPSASLDLDPVDVSSRVVAALRDLGAWPKRLTPEATAKIVESANWSTGRLSPLEQYFSGVVFAGFGAKQKLPSLRCHLLGVPYGGKLRKKYSRIEQVSPRRPAIIAPFAENGMARTFMEGVDPSIRKWFDGMVKQQAEELNRGPSYAKELSGKLDFQINQRAESIMTAVSYLPKAGLAEFAESLVRITALSLRMSMAPETVGEPIDVAVLSRSDGLVWVKRTPYFSRDLQPPLPAFSPNRYDAGYGDAEGH